MATLIAISHHEKWNGEGYPYGLAQEEIPLVGRIAALADYYDALTSRRPYRDAVPVEIVIEMIRKESGQHFDPRVVDVFLQYQDECEKLRRLK
jgi:putative two-component system response regulator